MPQSSFKGQVIAPLGGVIRCPCGQTFTYVPDRDLSTRNGYIVGFVLGYQEFLL